MCGLAGAFGNLYAKDVNAFKDLFYMAGLRGIHSAGIAAVRGRKGDRESSIIKTVGGPSNLMDYNAFDKEVNPSAVALIGHARHATIGAINHYNAHPFDIGNVVGCHNGTLRGNWRKELGDEATDSRALIQALDYNDPKDVFEAIEGAWAVSWYDGDNDSFNLVRNIERPLYVATLNDGRAVFYASEYMALHYALTRDARYKADEFTIAPLPVDTHYRWTIGHGGTIDHKAKPTARSVAKPKKETPVVTYYGRRVGSGGSAAHDDGPRYESEGNVTKLPVAAEQSKLPFPTGAGTPTTSSHGSNEPKGGDTDQLSVRPFRGRTLPFKDGNGRRLALDGESVAASDFNMYNTCLCCNAHVDYEDPKVVFLNAFEFLCKNCAIESPERANNRLEKTLATTQKLKEVSTDESQSSTGG